MYPNYTTKSKTQKDEYGFKSLGPIIFAIFKKKSHSYKGCNFKFTVKKIII